MPLNPEYVIAYTTGKVGSTSILETLRTVGVPCHRCTDANIHQYHKKDWPTISAVRDPIAWMFSKLFELYLSKDKKLLPDDAMTFVRSIEQSLTPLLPEQLLDYYCNWWGNEYRQTTGINIYGGRWLKKKGWEIYSMRSLIVRTDKIDEVMEDALTAFLPQYYPDIDLSTLEVQHRAKGTERFEGYEEFMDAVRFDPHWLAHFYDKTKMCRWFFLVDEMKEWIRKWAKGR